MVEKNPQLLGVFLHLEEEVENGKEQESKPISNEGNLHLDTSFGFWQNLEKVAALGNKKIGDIQSVGNNLATQWKYGPIAFVLFILILIFFGEEVLNDFNQLFYRTAILS